MKLTTIGLCGTLLATAACTPYHDGTYNNDPYASDIEMMFDRVDSNNDGYITQGESNLFARKMFVEADLNNDNRVTYQEFADHKYRMHGYTGNRYSPSAGDDGVYNSDGELIHGYNAPYNERNKSYRGDRNQYKGAYGADLYYNDQYDRWERR